jgi:hypothetical protein
MNYKYHYFYKISNNINGKFYYGIHSTNNLNDGYMGSGTNLKRAIKKYGIRNFTKEIIKFFDNRKDCAKYESEIVTEELVIDKSCYNLILGGEYINTSGTATVKDKEGNIFQIPLSDERIKNGELVGVTKGHVNCFDKQKNKYVQISLSEFSSSKERYNGLTYNMVTCRLKGSNDNYTLIDKKEFYSNIDKYETPTSNTITCKDGKGNIFNVPIDNDDYKNGLLVPLWTGLKHSEETKIKMSKKHRENGDQKGTKNSQYGTCWITKDGLNKKINKNDLDSFLNDGWHKGRFIK